MKCTVEERVQSAGGHRCNRPYTGYRAVTLILIERNVYISKQPDRVHHRTSDPVFLLLFCYDERAVAIFEGKGISVVCVRR